METFEGEIGKIKYFQMFHTEKLFESLTQLACNPYTLLKRLRYGLKMALSSIIRSTHPK